VRHVFQLDFRKVRKVFRLFRRCEADHKVRTSGRACGRSHCDGGIDCLAAEDQRSKGVLKKSLQSVSRMAIWGNVKASTCDVTGFADELPVKKRTVRQIRLWEIWVGAALRRWDSEKWMPNCSVRKTESPSELRMSQGSVAGSYVLTFDVRACGNDTRRWGLGAFSSGFGFTVVARQTRCMGSLRTVMHRVVPDTELSLSSGGDRRSSVSTSNACRSNALCA
jgi:hypothetical protein